MADPRICSVEGCSKPYKCGGYCASHYGRFFRHGDPLKGKAGTGELLAWLKSARWFAGDDCLLWPFVSNRNGYGAIRVNGRLVGAHHQMAIWVHGERPDGNMEAAHNCGNRRCVNPRHLRWATVLENHADMIAHGTSLRGTKNSHNKLTEQQARTIKYHRQNDNHSALASEYGVDPCTIMDIRKGRTWAWLQERYV